MLVLSPIVVYKERCVSLRPQSTLLGFAQFWSVRAGARGLRPPGPPLLLAALGLRRNTQDNHYHDLPAGTCAVAHVAGTQSFAGKLTGQERSIP
jgi:hypothetical protein